MDKIVKELVSQFKKREILKVTDELGLDTQDGTPVTKLISDILENLDTEGIPEPEECSDILFEFMVAAEYIDDEGNVLDEEEVESEPESEVVTEDQYPECFTFEDDRDPSCMKCKVREICKIERVNNRPECFGISFDANAEECKACLEANFCKQVVHSIRS